MVAVKVKRLTPEAKMPVKAYTTDSGFDLFAIADQIIPAKGFARTYSGVAFELPVGYEIQLRGRSGLAGKGITVHHGTVDADYRGEVAAILFNNTDVPYQVKVGERICQIVVKEVPVVQLIEVDELTPTSRGSNGFGSTGK